MDIVLIVYYIIGLVLLVFGGRVRRVREFLAAFVWAFVWPLVLIVGYYNPEETGHV